LSIETVQLRQQDGIPLAVVRRQVAQSDLSRVVPECCGRVWNALRAQGGRGGRHVAVYWDGTIRLEVGVEYSGELVERDGVVRSATPAGLVASVAHFGPYGDLGLAHDAVRGWCKANGHALAGPSWEIYDHWRSEWDRNPSLIRTDVFYQVAG
jgi:effector-binding domain-containing protein